MPFELNALYNVNYISDTNEVEFYKFDGTTEDPSFLLSVFKTQYEIQTPEGERFILNCEKQSPEEAVILVAKMLEMREAADG